MYQVEYAALKYYNNVISDECLYIGMLFHNLTTGKRDFRYISNFKRFQAFDDEADIDFIKLYLAGIKRQVEISLLNYQDNFSIANFTKIYVNEFRFSEVTTMVVEENDDYVENLTKMYLKFDFNKEKRLSNSLEKKYIRKILASSKVDFSIPKISGTYEENVTFDYIIGDVAVKLFSFKEKNAGKMIEYRMIPLLVCSARIGEELNAAAITRGLGGDVKRTNVCQIGFHIQDYVLILVCAVPYLIWILSILK